MKKAKKISGSYSVGCADSERAHCLRRKARRVFFCCRFKHCDIAARDR